MQPQPKCPRCAQDLAYIQEYQRWYCTHCQMYMPSYQEAQPPTPYYPPIYYQPPPPPPPMGHGPWPAGFTAPTEEGGRSKIYEALRVRREADRPLSTRWIWVLVVANIGAVSFTILWLLLFLYSIYMGTDLSLYTIILGVCIFIFGAMLYITQAYVVYRLVDSRDMHFRRDALLRQGMIELLTAKNISHQGVAGMEVATMSALHTMSASEEGAERDALMWAVLVAIPVMGTIALWYLLYTLTTESFKHDSRQEAFSRQGMIAFAKLGEPHTSFYWAKLSEKPAALYLILSIFIPFIVYYWMHTVFTEWSAHFVTQWRFEDALLQHLGRNTHA
ncbi:MAG: hypothetical protein AB1665_03275 [Candidatus Thermoplasmatota archaeon]